MSIAVKGWDGAPFDANSIENLAGRFLTTVHKLVFTGNYATNGDTCDLSGVQPPAQARGLVKVDPISNGPAASLGNVGGFYQYVPGTTLANGLLKVFKNNAGSTVEYSAGAYGTDVTTDVVYLEIKWAR